MKSVKNFSRTFVGDQPRLPRLICLEVTAQQRQPEDPAQYGSLRKTTSLVTTKTQVFLIIFQKLYEVWKGFFKGFDLIPTATISIRLEVTAQQRQR